MKFTATQLPWRSQLTPNNMSPPVSDKCANDVLATSDFLEGKTLGRWSVTENPGSLPDSSFVKHNIVIKESVVRIMT